MPNYNNPFEQFSPMDFSLWAHPAKGSQIKEEDRTPLAPTSASPLYPANQPGEAPPSTASTDAVNVGGISMPAPQAAPLAAKAPTSPVIPPGAVNPNQNVLGRVHDRIHNTLTGDTPTGYESLLSPEEIQAARPGLVQSLFGAEGSATPQTRWQQNLDDLVARKQHQAGIVANQRVQDATAKLFAEFPPPKSGSAEDYQKWANKVHPGLVAIGNFGAAKELLPLVTEEFKPDPNAALKTEWIDNGDQKVLTNKVTGQVIARMKKGVAPKDAAQVSAEQKNAQDQQNKILDDYRADTKEFKQVMGGWDVLKGASKDPSLATPFAVTDAYARITNPGGIVRPTTMEMIDNMGSVGQRMKKFWEHNANGALPPEILKDFQHTLFNIVNEHKKQFDETRSMAIERGKRSGVSNIGDLLSNYDVQDISLPAAITKYNITPVRKP